jgi:hypothetical protein
MHDASHLNAAVPPDKGTYTSQISIHIQVAASSAVIEQTAPHPNCWHDITHAMDTSTTWQWSSNGATPFTCKNWIILHAMFPVGLPSLKWLYSNMMCLLCLIEAVQTIYTCLLHAELHHWMMWQVRHHVTIFL